MAYRLEDGTGSRSKAAVFKNRLRTFAVEDSLTNHLSVESGNISQEDVLNGEVIGTFTVSGLNTQNLTNAARLVFLTLVNNDLINLLVIDRVYVQVFSTGPTLPSPFISIVIDNTTLNTSRRSGTSKVFNENLSSNIIPIVTTYGSITANLLATTDIIASVFPALGEMNELIIPGSNAIILPGGPTPNPATFGTANNVFALSFINNSTIPIVFKVYSFIRFMMVNPKNIG